MNGEAYPHLHPSLPRNIYRKGNPSWAEEESFPRRLRHPKTKRESLVHIKKGKNLPQKGRTSLLKFKNYYLSV